jgi:4-hydroxy-tetrahydrodipicolinate synthase
VSFTPKGIIPAMVTPLNEQRKLNKEAFRRFIIYLIDGGMHGIFVSGTTGEFYGLSEGEKKEMFEITVQEVDGRVPVYAGTGAITTKECIELTRIAESCGVDAVSILTPMFISPTQDELFEHYRSIAASTRLPVLLYNNLPKTGVTVTPATVQRLAQIDNIVGVKDSSGDFTLTSEYIRRTRNTGFSVLSGRDTLIHACLCYGGAGSIAACANIAPRICADIYDKYVAGDVAGSLEAQFAITPLRLAFTLGSFPTVIKEGLKLLGIDAGPCMSPIGPMNREEKEELKKILTQMGLLS